jgi:hypothetical protein
MSRARTLAVALAVGACGAALSYAASRALQVWLFPMPDPRTVLAPGRIAFYWRSWIALYVGTLTALGAAALRTRAPSAFDRALPGLIVLTAVATTLQGVLLP